MNAETPSIESVYELLQEAYYLPHGDQQIQLIEEAVRLADLTQDIEVQYEARMELVQAAVFGGEDDKALVAFPWCLAQHDRNPDLGNEFELLWRYKWMFNHTAGFPQISKTQINLMLADMEKRYIKANAGLRAVYQSHYLVNRVFGEKEIADHYFQKWKAAERDYYADCAACEADTEIHHWIFMNNPTKALEKSQPILDGKLKCGEIPHITYARVLIPLVELGRFDEAINYHRIGYPMISENKDFLGFIGEHIIFLTLANELNKAQRIFEKHFDWALKVKNSENRFNFFQAGYFLFLTMAESDRKICRLRLPKEFSGFQEKSDYETDVLISYLKNELEKICTAFDRRNENNFYTRMFNNTVYFKKLRFRLS